MKYFLLVICICSLPQLGHAAGNTTTPYSPPQKPSYRHGHPSPPEACRQSCWCGSPEVGAEALLWRNSTSDFGYVKSSIDGIGTLVRDQPHYDWGVRAYIGYHFPSCWGARVSYSYFEDRFSDSRTGTATPPLLTPVYGAGVVVDNLAFASATVRDRFQTVDAEAIAQLFCGCVATFKAFGGARWIDLQVRERYVYIPLVEPPFDVTQRSDFTGAGPRFGVYSSLTPIPCGCFKGFEVYGQLAISAIVGRRSFVFVGSQ